MAETTPGPILGKVGDIRLVLGNAIPVGFVSLCEGKLVNRSTYPELWEWVQNNGRVLSDTDWNSHYNTNGSCAYFSHGDGSTTFRLPKITSILRADVINKTAQFNKAVYNDSHYHGIGTNVNNNGNWGYKTYSSTFPSGSLSSGWNGRGGGSAPSGTPPNNGTIITSLNIPTGYSGSPCPATTNICICMRYTTDYQTTATSANVMAAYESVSLMSTRLEEANEAYNVSCNLDKSGWQLYNSGLLVEWGSTNPGESEGDIVFPITFLDDNPPYIVSVTVVDPNHELDSPIKVVLGEPSESKVSYRCIGELPSDAYITWEATGRN